MNIVTQAIGGIYQIMRGLKTVATHTFRPPTTGEYPDYYPDLPSTFRGRLALAVNPETGENLCISCRQCERVCPDKCIVIDAHKSTETNKLELIDFQIDHGLCMFCGLCTEVCPTNCIINTQDLEMADYSRAALVYDLKKLTLTQDESAYYFEKKELPIPKPKPVKAAAPAATAAAKPASSSVSPEAQPTSKSEPGSTAAPTGLGAPPASSAKPAGTEALSGATPASNEAAGAHASGVQPTKQSGESEAKKPADDKSQTKPE